MIDFITTATSGGGGDVEVVSFGSGDSGGRTQRSARGGQNARRVASRQQVSSLRSRIQRAGTTGRSKAARDRRELLQRLDASANRRGNRNRGGLAQIAEALREINSRPARGRRA